MNEGVASPGLSAPIGRAALMVALPVLGAISPWLLIPVTEDLSRGADMPTGDVAVALVPLVSAFVGLAVAARYRMKAAIPLLPFALTGLVWAYSVLAGWSDAAFVFGLFAMPLLALAGGCISVRRTR